MKKMLFIVLISLFGCNTAIERNIYEQKQKSIDTCTRNIKVIKDNDKRPYEIIDIISIEYPREQREEAIIQLKYLACARNNAEAITYPCVSYDSENITYISEVVKFR